MHERRRCADNCARLAAAQIVYSLPDPKRVRQGLGCNMLWRWFVGYLLRSEPLPEPRAFVQNMNKVSAHPHVVGIVFRCLANSALLQGGSEEFRINHGLLRTLRAQHLDLTGR